ncbi:MAG: enoyl-CoA hydratase/isomerase family protein [Chloroflexi bacterium]|nr:enoyl-CoA hydratase/isomerase family protein [Chloroflexota bacterium]
MPDLIYEKRDHYAIFTMNRPERLNALGGAMQDDLEDALTDFNADPNMRAGIVTGNGRAFCAGADLKEMSERNARVADIEARFTRGEITLEQRRDELKRVNRGGGLERTFQFSRNAKPIIAAVNGLAIGGGMERAMDCDIRIASTEAYFGLFEIKRGILAGYGIHSLGRLVPFGEAMYILLTADRVSAQEAHRIGFVHDVVEPDRLMPRAIEIAEMIASNAPIAVQGTKAVASYWRQLNMDESYRFGSWVSRYVLGSEDAKEGPRAFAEKRAPVWKNR